MLGMPWSFSTTTGLGAVPPPSPAAQHHREVAMSDLDDFLTPTLARQLEAEQALINGDPEPRLAMWSTQEPVTVFGAERTVIGSEEVTQVFRWLATRFSNLTDYRFELVAAGVSGDLAYTLGYEHVVFSIDGGPVEPLTLRVTHLYAARTASGGSSTAMPTSPLPVRSVPPTHRRSRHRGQRDQLQVHIFVSTQHPRTGRRSSAWLLRLNA